MGADVGDRVVQHLPISPFHTRLHIWSGPAALHGHHFADLYVAIQFEGRTSLGDFDSFVE